MIIDSKKLFSIVDPTCERSGRDWKDPICKLIFESDLPQGVNTEMIAQAVEYFTATELKIERKPVFNRKKGCDDVILTMRARGYRNGPAC